MLILICCCQMIFDTWLLWLLCKSTFKNNNGWCLKHTCDANVTQFLHLPYIASIAMCALIEHIKGTTHTCTVQSTQNMNTVWERQCNNSVTFVSLFDILNLAIDLLHKQAQFVCVEKSVRINIEHYRGCVQMASHIYTLLKRALPRHDECFALLHLLRGLWF